MSKRHIPVPFIKAISTAPTSSTLVDSGPIPLLVVASTTIAQFDIVYENGRSTTIPNLIRVTPADADAAASIRPPLYVALSAGVADKVLEVSPGPIQIPLDTSAGAVGDLVYASNTAGGKSLSAGTISQPIGKVSKVGTVVNGGSFTFLGSMASVSSAGASLSWPDGTAAAPGLPKASDPDTGFYGLAANNIGVALGGVASLGMGTSAPSIAAATDTAGAAFYARAPSGGASPTAARNGGRFDLAAGNGSAGATTVAAGAGGLYVSASGNGGDSSGTGAGGAGGTHNTTAGSGGAKTGTGAAAGGAGGSVTRSAGVGGATASTSTGAGGAGGAFSDTAGDGGAATGAGSTGNGGTGGGFTRLAGVGGTTIGGTSGAGGAISDASGAGAASAGAVAAGIGGAFTSASGAGGANTGGATGQAGGAAGAYNITGGAGGATNSTGAHAGGAGAKITITSGAGGNATAGTGNGGAGGDIDLVPGAGGTSAGGTAGVKGQVKVNGVALMIDVTGEYVAASVDKRIFTANRAYRVIGIRGTPDVAGTDGGAVTAVVRKVTSGTAITAGQALHTGSYDLKGTVNTVQSLTLTSTDADLLLAAGDSIAIDFTGTLTDATGVISVGLLPV